MVSRKIRIFHYITACSMVIIVISLLLFGYRAIRFMIADKAEHYYSSELYKGAYVSLDYDYIVTTRVCSGDQSYSFCRLRDKDEYVLVLFDGLTSLFLSSGDQFFSDGSLFKMMQMENIPVGENNTPGTLYGIVEASRDTMINRFQRASEVICEESGGSICPRPGENINLNSVIVFKSKTYYSTYSVVMLILFFVDGIIFIISTRLYSTRKREEDAKVELAAEKERRVSEMLENLNKKRRGY